MKAGASGLLLLIAGTLVSQAPGQGLYPSSSTVRGAANPAQTLLEQYRSSKAWRNSYKLNPKSACSRANSKSRSGAPANLCASSASGNSSADFYVQIMLATSPSVYSSASSGYTGGLKLAGPVRSQDPCDTCTAFAVTSAAEIAVASVQRVDTGDISISPQGLYFCTDVTRDCTAGWNLPDALRQLQEKAAQIPTMGCLPYQPDITGQRTPDQLCSGRCSDAQPYASQGKFSFKQISNILAAQQHIRQYGSVVSSFDVYDDLKPFFAVKGNVKKVYRPGKTARLAFGHAVVLVGYNNDEQYWIVQNSWGNWADGGYFKVAFDTCSILVPLTGEAYGIIWTSDTPWKLPVTRSNIRNCYWYMAQPGDYPSRLALITRIPLEKFLLDNTPYIKDLDKPLMGIQVLLCNPVEGTSANTENASCSRKDTRRQTVTGAASGGYVWGSNPYTTDSDLSVAAVHAGLVKPGETATINIISVGRLNTYPGSTSNGVTTSGWFSSWCGIAVGLAEGAADCSQASTLQNITGSTSGSKVWGSNPYTTDSDLAVAAVHAGLVKPGETAELTKLGVGKLQNFVGSTSNGITTSDWNKGWCGLMLQSHAG